MKCTDDTIPELISENEFSPTPREHREPHIKLIMKERTDWNKIDNDIKISEIEQQLVTACEDGTLRRRKTAEDLLAQVKASLIKAREKGASYASIAAFLTERGMPVSEPTLREYLSKIDGSKKSSKKGAQKDRTKTAEPLPPASEETPVAKRPNPSRAKQTPPKTEEPQPPPDPTSQNLL